MSKESKIAEIIKLNNLVGGMPMMNVNFEEIPNTCVIDSHSFAEFDREDNVVRIHREKVLLGGETTETFSVEAFATLQGWGVLEEAA